MPRRPKRLPEHYDPAVRYGVVIADDNRAYANWSDTARGAASAHYVCERDISTTIAIGDWLRSVLLPDSIAALWGSWPHVTSNTDLGRGWGFDEQVTGWPWIKVAPANWAAKHDAMAREIAAVLDELPSSTTRADLPDVLAKAIIARIVKPKRGIGFWGMSTSEFVTFWRRGNPKRIAVKPNVMALLVGEPRVIFDRVQGHSRKPYGLHEWLEDSFPDVGKLELYATELRPGWTCLGHRTGWHLTPDGPITLVEAKARKLLPRDYDPWRDPTRKGGRWGGSKLRPKSRAK